jgi:hypothetical protein
VNRRGPRVHSHGLFPKSWREAHHLFHLLRESISSVFVGQEEQVDRLVLLGVRHLARDLVQPTTPLRALILGPASSGKSTLLRTFAEALGLPHSVIPAQSMAEQNWSGSDVGDFIGRLYEGVAFAPSLSGATALVERAVVGIDGLDALRLPGRYGSASSRDYQLGRQQSLVPLFEGGVVPIERNGSSVYWPSRNALVIACGIFVGLPARVPSADDLTDWGLIPQLSDRLAAGTLLRVTAPLRAHVPAIIERSLETPKQAFALFGYELSVSPEAIAFVADRINVAEANSGVGEAIGWIAEAAERVLAGMVRDGAAPATRHVLAPDDIRMVPRSRGTWRE